MTVLLFLAGLTAVLALAYKFTPASSGPVSKES